MYGTACLTAVYPLPAGIDLEQALTNGGAALRCTVNTPATKPGQIAAHALGSFQDMAFTAQAQSTTRGARELSLQLHFPADGATHTAPLLTAIHEVADSMFAAAGDVDAAVVTYLAHRLHRNSPRNVSRLLADMSALIADQLASTVPMIDHAAMLQEPHPRAPAM